MVPTTSRPSTTAALDRHERRREAGTPTVSVLAGSPGLAQRTARQWAEGMGRAVVRASDPELAALCQAWIAGTAAGRDVSRDAVSWLAARRQVPAEELAGRVARATPFEVETFLDVALSDQPTDTAAACKWLVRRLATGLTVRGAPEVDEIGAAAERVLAALCELVPPGEAPVLLVTVESDQVDRAAASLARLAEIAPGLTVLCTVEAAAFERYRLAAPESRAKAVLRAGVVPVASLDEDAVGRIVARELTDVADRLAGSVRRLAADGASDELVALYVDAVKAVAAREEGHARSAAERFLFERLESLAATAGRFALNAALGIAFGPGRAMEVDLWAETLGLAVEIDGYYHFQHADAYRRDRRKDFQLQRHGHLVVRVLAEDVVERLEDVLDLILDAVALRRERDNPLRGEGP